MRIFHVVMRNVIRSILYISSSSKLNSNILPLTIEHMKMCKIIITNGQYELVWKTLEVGHELCVLNGQTNLISSNITNVMSNTTRFKAVQLSNGLNVYVELFNPTLNDNGNMKCYVLIMNPVECKILYKFVQDDMFSSNNIEYSTIRDLF